jgi:hypothetical protein
MAWATAFAIGSLATSAYAKWKAGKAEAKAGTAQRQASESQADLADYNAAIATLQATDAIQRGQLEAYQFRSGVRVLVGSQRTGIAAGNVDVGYGSAVDAQADAMLLGELDALTIRTNAAREAWGYQVESDDLRRRAEIARKEGVYLEAAGRERQSAARLGSVSTVVGGGASLLQARYGKRPA